MAHAVCCVVDQGDSECAHDSHAFLIKRKSGNQSGDMTESESLFIIQCSSTRVMEDSGALVQSQVMRCLSWAYKTNLQHLRGRPGGRKRQCGWIDSEL